MKLRVGRQMHAWGSRKSCKGLGIYMICIYCIHVGNYSPSLGFTVWPWAEWHWIDRVLAHCFCYSSWVGQVSWRMGVNYFDDLASCACLDTGVLTEPPSLFQAYDPGFLPSRLPRWEASYVFSPTTSAQSTLGIPGKPYRRMICMPAYFQTVAFRNCQSLWSQNWVNNEELNRVMLQ